MPGQKNLVSELTKWINHSRALFFRDPNTGKKIYGVPVRTDDPDVIEIVMDNVVLATIRLSGIRDIFGGLVWVKLNY